MKTLEMEIPIPIPKGYEAESFDLKTLKLKLREKKKDVLDFDDEDVLADNGYTLDSFNRWCDGLRSYERADRFLELLHKSFNGDWVPDFDDDNQPKYQPR